jgi:carbonic anhydrase
LLDDLADVLPGVGTTAMPSKVIDLVRAFPGDRVPNLSDFYYYLGSLTTYPFTEGVHWFVHKQIVGASPQKIELLGELLPPNARQTQPLVVAVYG